VKKVLKKQPQRMARNEKFFQKKIIIKQKHRNQRFTVDRTQKLYSLWEKSVLVVDKQVTVVLLSHVSSINILKAEEKNVLNVRPVKSTVRKELR